MISAKWPKEMGRKTKTKISVLHWMVRLKYGLKTYGANIWGEKCSERSQFRWITTSAQDMSWVSHEEAFWVFSAWIRLRCLKENSEGLYLPSSSKGPWFPPGRSTGGSRVALNQGSLDQKADVIVSTSHCLSGSQIYYIYLYTVYINICIRPRDWQAL